MTVILGVDPGRATGWALLRGDDADSLRHLASGVLSPHGAQIQALLHSVAHRPDLVAVERQYGNQLLVDTYGRWLGLCEARGLPVAGVWASSWKSRFVGPHRTPRLVADPKTGRLRTILPAEKRAAKRTADEAYRLLAVERFGLPPHAPADVAAAAWIAACALDDVLRSRS